MAEETALPQPGEVFAGRYLIEQIIGSAKMSVVFGARHSVTGKRFAIRWSLPGEGAAEVTPENVVPAPDASRATTGEHQVVGHFRHPNVLEVFDVGEVSGSFYTVMDWLEGESLQARLHRFGALPVTEACRLLVPCMRGMHEAHAAGIIHRDLKPANIFICHATDSSPEIVKVLDFQVATFAGADAEAALIAALKEPSLGSPYYRAPELFAEVPTDHRVDVYAFGAILYEILAGRPPFAPTRYAPSDVGSGHALALQHRVDKLPHGALQIIARAMAREVDARFQTLGELADAFEQYASRAGAGVVTRQTQFLSGTQQTGTSAPLSTPYSTEALRGHDSAQPSQLGSLSGKQWYIAAGLALLAAATVLLVNTIDTGVVESYEAVGGEDGATVELRPEAPESTLPPLRRIETSRSAALAGQPPVAPAEPVEPAAVDSDGASAPTRAEESAPVRAEEPVWRFPSVAVPASAGPARPRRVDTPARVSKRNPAPEAPARPARSAPASPSARSGESDPLDMNLM